MSTQHTPTAKESLENLIKAANQLCYDAPFETQGYVRLRDAVAESYIIVQTVNSQDALLEAAKVAHDALHQSHPNVERIAIGKGICEWGPCKQLRAAIAAVERGNA